MRNADMSLMSFAGKTNAVLELGRRLIQPEEEWRDKCVAFQELRQLISGFCMHQHTHTIATEAPEATKVITRLFTPENVQALTQPFRVTVTDLRSTVVKEACTTLSLLTKTLGLVGCKILVRDVFPTLLEARGGSNKVNITAVHSCIKEIVATTPSRFVLAPVLQMLDTSKNRDVRESCIHYVYLALEGWKTAVLERFKIPLQSTIATSLSDASAKGREKARDCYWKYISIWPDEVNRMNQLLPDGVKKHLKRPRKVAGLETYLQPPKRRHLATITNIVFSTSAAKHLLPGDNGVLTKIRLGKVTQRLGTPLLNGERREAFPASDKQAWAKLAPLLGKHGENSPNASTQPSRIPSTPISSLKKPRGGNAPSKISTPQHLPRPRTMPEAKSTILEDKCAQFQRENAFPAKTLEIQTQGFQRLHNHIQMMSEDKQLNELRRKNAVTAIMPAHAVEKAPQHEMQCNLAEQQASQDNEPEDLQCNNSPLSNSIPSSSQDQVTTLKSELSSLTEQLLAATAKLEARNAEASDEMSALRSEKSVLEDRLSAESAQLEELQTQQNAAVAALAEEKDGRMAQLEGELSSLTEQLQAATAKLEARNAEASDEMSALRSEKSVLEDRLSAESAQLEELQTQQNAAVAALAEEKDGRVAQLEGELSSLTEQLLAATAKLEARNAEASDEMSALRSEKSVLEDRLSAESAQLEELQTQQNAAVAALAEEKDGRVAQLEGELSSLTEQLQAATAKLEARNAEASDEMSALRSEKSVLEDRLSAESAQLEELQTQQNAAVAALAEEKDGRVAQLEGELSSLTEQLQAATAKLEARNAEASDEMSALRSEKSVLEDRLSAESAQLEELQTQQNAAVAALAEEKDGRMAQLEGELSSLTEQLQAATAKLEARNAEASDEMSALRSEKSVLEDRLSAESAQLEELQTQQNAAVAALAEEKDGRVAQLEGELSSLTEQLLAATAKLEARNAEASDEMSALRSEKSVLEDRLSAQSAQLEELQTQQNAAVAALEEEKNLLARELSALKIRHSAAVVVCNETGLRRNDGLDDNDFTAGRSEVLTVVTDDEKAKPAVPIRAFSLARARDRFEIEDEERRINEANLLKRRLRRRHKRKA